MIQVVRTGHSVYPGHCRECGTEFNYEREDVRHNFLNDMDWVTCPHCGQDLHHYGFSGTEFPPQRSNHG